MAVSVVFTAPMRVEFTLTLARLGGQNPDRHTELVHSAVNGEIRV
jgi:hypothetical protein